MPGKEQHGAERYDLVFAQSIVSAGRGQQPRDQVGPGRGPALGSDPAQIGAEVKRHPVALGHDVPGALVVEHGSDGQRPVLDPAVVIARDAQQFADGGQRQREGVVGDDVKRLAPGETVQQLGRQGLDPRPQRLHHADGEGLVEQRSLAGMVGRLQGKRPSRVQVPEGLAFLRRHGRRRLVEHGGDGAAEARVFQDIGDIVVAEEIPPPAVQARRRRAAAVDRVCPPETVIDGVRVGPKRRVEDVEEG